METSVISQTEKQKENPKYGAFACIISSNTVPLRDMPKSFSLGKANKFTFASQLCLVEDVKRQNDVETGRVPNGPGQKVTHDFL